MALSTVAVTGGNGTIGKALLQHLNEHGYSTVNIARGKRRESVSDDYITTDLLDAGETYGALAASNADAVVHMGTIPSPGRHPQHRTYESNTLSSIHVLEASESLDFEACCLASSINVMGAEHQQRDPQVEYFPVDDSHPRTPDDIYGIAKHAIEVTADGFGRRPDSDLTISTLRYPWVASEQEIRTDISECDRSLSALRTDSSHTGVEVLFSYLHIGDACTLARNAVEADYTGHESFWAVAADTTAGVPSSDLINEFFPEPDIRTEFTGHETLYDISKADSLLDWTPELSWRDI
jgi:nucleoside-diphosphate-sugar epimerase